METLIESADLGLKTGGPEDEKDGDPPQSLTPFGRLVRDPGVKFRNAFWGALLASTSSRPFRAPHRAPPRNIRKRNVKCLPKLMSAISVRGGVRKFHPNKFH